MKLFSYDLLESHICEMHFAHDQLMSYKFTVAYMPYINICTYMWFKYVVKTETYNVWYHIYQNSWNMSMFIYYVALFNNFTLLSSS